MADRVLAALLAAAWPALLPAASGDDDAADRVGDPQRAEALWRIARSGNPEAQVVLVEAARDASAVVRRAAMQAIAATVRRPAAEVRAALRGGLSDPHPLVVLAAAAALQVHVDPGAAEALSSVVLRPPSVRAGDELPAVEGAATWAAEWEIAAEALQALRATPGWRRRPDILVKLLASRDPEARLVGARAAAGLAGKGEPRGKAMLLEPLAKAMTGPSRRVRLAAAEALARLGDPRGSGLLMDWLRRPPRPDGARHRAAAALEKLTGRDWGSGEAAWNADDPAAAALVKRRIEQLEACLKAANLATGPPDIVPKELTAADKALFGRLREMGLFDPAGAQPLRVTYLRRTVRGGLVDANALAWRRRTEAKRPETLYGTWGRQIRRTKRAADLEAAEWLDLSAWPEAARTRPPDEQPLILAAWADRLGLAADAARLLFQAREEAYDDNELLDGLRRSACQELLLDAVHAYMVAADDEALEAAERLVRLGGRHADAFGPGTALLAELKRRQAAGTFGKPPQPLPDDLSRRPVGRRVAALIASLEDVAVRQEAQPGGVDLAADPRVLGLIEIGDAAVPALIDCIRTDPRLTRSVHFRRDFLPERWVLAVREAALVAVQSILRRSFFEPQSPADNFTRHGAGAAAAVAGRIGEYWRTWGAVPLPRRMMKVLADDSSPPGELRVAAKTLAALGGQAVFGTTIGTSRLVKTGRRPSPAATMFDGPTAAEAILAAMARDLAAFDAAAGTQPPPADEQRDRIEILYVRALAALGDRRIANRLARRYRAARSLEVRRVLAEACDHLGRGDVLRDFRAGLKATRPAAASSRCGS